MDEEERTKQAEEFARLIAEHMRSNEGDLHVFDKDDALELERFAKWMISHPEEVKELCENPRALLAWIWIYDTFDRLKFLGVSATGLLKWGLIFIGTLTAYKNGLLNPVITGFKKWWAG